MYGTDIGPICTKCNVSTIYGYTPHGFGGTARVVTARCMGCHAEEAFICYLPTSAWELRQAHEWDRICKAEQAAGIARNTIAPPPFSDDDDDGSDTTGRL